jgi:hypothetical protein
VPDLRGADLGTINAFLKPGTVVPPFSPWWVGGCLCEFLQLIEQVLYCACGEGHTRRLRPQHIMEMVEEEAGYMFHP